MTTEQLDGRIQTLEEEKKSLIASHQQAAEQWQKTLAANQTRAAQIDGAILELQSIKGSDII